MAPTSPWPSIAYERLALAEDLADVHGSKWDHESLCAGWSNRVVLGHVVATAKLTPPKFAVGMATAFGKFSRFSDKAARREGARHHSELLGELKDLAVSQDAPPGPVDAWLGEIIVHGTDIRLPLGMAHEYAVADVVRVADFYAGSNALTGARKRIDGLALRATDADWSHGTGSEEVVGPLILLVMAMTGRKGVVLDGLKGDGLDVLTSR
ncbi:maleylpyruvate isomerase family mycothiol-dependent enzyme [Rhodococcus aerolatus]